MTTYQPGNHIVATLLTTHTAKLDVYEGCKIVIDELISACNLSNLGEVYHNFTPAGFTAIICLSESHIAIHTWPEFGKVNLDIYLSNFERNNDGTVTLIFNRLVAFFDAIIVNNQTLIR